ncbi:MAG TPA: AhpC/TSA family protein [Burkholderiaceae bacterium]|jgi:hypothetical protein|nr:AhpC/TSA family protein [Burkholderiaceae bacterium]
MTSIWFSRPNSRATSALVKTGDAAPNSSAFSAPEQLRVVAFLRHVGCPFAENTVKELRTWAEQHPLVSVFVVSHASADATAAWCNAIGGTGRLRMIIDTQRELHAKWGVGFSSFWHFAGPASLLGVVALLGKGIRNRSAAGTRWQRAAVFLINGDQIVWSHVPDSAEEFALPPDQLVQIVGAVDSIPHAGTDSV